MTEPTQPPEQRLPATRPPDQVSAERFTAAPPVKAIDGLTPERAAGIVRQSSSARWIAFLAVCFVSLFVILYWFYELGAPLGISTPRLVAEASAQQVTAVERGYNLYEANCARCHGPQGLGPTEPDAAAKAAAGQGYIGPQLNDQSKLFAHLNANYLRNVLTVGGRYVCGNAKSQMPVWSDKGNPPGPLNYRQIDELIAFLTATNDKTYEIRDSSLNEPIIDPATGKVETFKPWKDPNYKPDPGATPYPDCYLDALTGGAGSSASPGASVDANAPVVTVTAPVGAAASGFDPTTLEAKADTKFTWTFDNQDTGVLHNAIIENPDGSPVDIGSTAPFAGPEKRSYAVPALKAGDYKFICQVHPTTMTGTLTVK